MKQFEKMSGNAQEKLKTLIGSNDNPSSMFKSPCFATSVNDDFNKLNLSLHQKKRGRPPLSNQSRKSTKQNDERSQKCDNPQCVNPKHSGKHKMPFVLKIKLKMSLDLKNETQCLSCGRAINTYG